MLQLKVDLGDVKTLIHRDPMMKTWHQYGFHSAFSPGCPCDPKCHYGPIWDPSTQTWLPYRRCPRANGVVEEYCVRDARRVHVVGIVPGNTKAAAEAGYTVCGARLVFDHKKHMRRVPCQQPEATCTLL